LLDRSYILPVIVLSIVIVLILLRGGKTINISVPR